MSQDFINDLLHALSRVATPDADRLKEVLILSGMPERTENLRYLGYNREEITEGGRTLEFSAVALINNRVAARWKLDGFWRKASRIIFGSKWTRNPLDFFLNNLRCDPDMIELLTSAEGNYTLLGLLEEVKKPTNGLFRFKFRCVRPVVATAGVAPEKLGRMADFEKSNEIRKIRIPWFTLYRK